MDRESGGTAPAGAGGAGERAAHGHSASHDGELARLRLSKRHFMRATTQAELYGPSDAVDAGYLDKSVPAAELESVALAEAARLADLPRNAFATTKRSVNGELADRILRTLDEDMALITNGPDLG